MVNIQALLHQSFVTTALHPPPPTTLPTIYGDGNSGANVRGGDLSSSPAVLDFDIMQIYPCGIYYKEQGYDSQQVPAVQGF